MEGYRKYREATGTDADDVKNAPRLIGTVYDIWKAWGHLTKSRNYTMGGMAGIPVSEVLAYVDYYRINDPLERDRLLYLIDCMDCEMMALNAPKDK